MLQRKNVATAEEGVQAPEGNMEAQTDITGIEEKPKMMACVGTEVFLNENPA